MFLILFKIDFSIFKFPMKRQYPFHKNIRSHLWVALGLSLWVFAFLYLSEPFDINNFSPKEKLTLLPIYSSIEGLCYVIPLLYQYHIFKKQRVCKYAVVPGEEGIYAYFEYTKKVYLPGLVVIVPFVIITRFIIGKFSEKTELQDHITIKGKGQYDFIKLNFNELLFIKSSDNYVEVHFFNGTTIEKKLIRENISEVEKGFPRLLKTHRSFLINPIHVKQYHIENKKLFIDLGHTSYIPVSRGLQRDVKSKLQFTTNK